jgi:hypothetical protein
MNLRRQLAVAVIAAAFMTPSLVVFGKSAPQDIWVVNQSGYSIYSVKISPHSSDSWGTNRLGLAEVLDYGEKLDFALSGYNTCRFDVQVEFSDGLAWTFRDGYNFCDISGIEVEDDQTVRLFDGNPQ